jgi:hypothetical protein
MTERTRDFLKPQFRDGERPSGSDFADLIDSFVNKQTDSMAFDADGNMVLTRGLRLGDSAGTAAGGLRFHNNQLEVFTGGAWVNAAGGGSDQFQAAPSISQSAVVRDSLIGIGTFAAAPTFKLEVQLDAATGPANQVRFGTVVCGHGAEPALQSHAVIAHQLQATDLKIDTCFALRQSPAGAVHLNAAPQQRISIRQGGTGIRLGVSKNGAVIVGDDEDLPGATANTAFQVKGDVFKTTPGVWAPSDSRTKEDVHDLELGLAELRRLRPVRYRYNGRAGTIRGRVGVGIIGQEIENIVPEAIQRVHVAEDGLDDFRIFDDSPLTYVLINAVKELATKVDQLERALAVATTQSGERGHAVA